MLTSAQIWPRVKTLFTEVIELPPAERGPFFTSIIAEPELLAELRRLVELGELSEGFLDQAPLQFEIFPRVPTRLEAGDVVGGRYRVERLIGRGGMCGGVFRATDLADGSLVALKITDNLHEFFVARTIQHPNACRMLDYGKAGETSFLTMELLQGETLEDRLATKGPLEGHVWMRFATQLCAAVAATHQAGILHCDIKPANIFLTSGHRLVLIDFGLARSMERSDVEAADQIRQSAGTIAYMAPELLMGRSASVRSDLYSMGVVLQEAGTYEGCVVQDCVALDPANRPASAALVQDRVALWER